MWSVQTIPLSESEPPKMVKESPSLALVMPTWNKCNKYQDVVTTLWDGEKLIMFHIPLNVRTPELVELFRTYHA